MLVLQRLLMTVLYISIFHLSLFLSITHSHPTTYLQNNSFLTTHIYFAEYAGGQERTELFSRSNHYKYPPLVSWGASEPKFRAKDLNIPDINRYIYSILNALSLNFIHAKSRRLNQVGSDPNR
jgi:hypothetical protein